MDKTFFSTSEIGEYKIGELLKRKIKFINPRTGRRKKGKIIGIGIVSAKILGLKNVTHVVPWRCIYKP